MKRQLLTLAAAATLTLSSCATIFTGTKDTIRFDSEPQGAVVLIDGLEVCVTPCVTRVKRSLSEKMAEIKLDGYETRVITLDRTFNVVSVINLGSILGWAIDAATGSIMRYDRKSYTIKLDPKDNATSYIENSSRIEINTKNKEVDLYVVQQ